MHVGDIESKTQYSPRTVRHVLRQLQRAQLVMRVPDMMDLRRHYYIAVGA